MNSVPARQRRPGARRPQPAAVSHRRRCAAARVPRRHPRRERRRHRGPGLRPGHRARHTRRRQPGPQSARSPEGDAMSTERRPSPHRRMPDMPGRMCPAGEYCGLCGCHLTPRHGRRPRLAAHPRLRRRAGRAPAAAVVGSSLFPHLPPRSRTVFRAGLAVVFDALVAFALLRLPAALVTVAALGFPFLFMLYLRESDGFADIPTRTWVAHRGAGHRSWRRMGALDGRDGGPVVRNRIGRGHRRGRACCARASASRWAG